MWKFYHKMFLFANLRNFANIQQCRNINTMFFKYSNYVMFDVGENWRNFWPVTGKTPIFFLLPPKVFPHISSDFLDKKTNSIFFDNPIRRRFRLQNSKLQTKLQVIDKWNKKQWFLLIKSKKFRREKVTYLKVL